MNFALPKPKARPQQPPHSVAESLSIGEGRASSHFDEIGSADPPASMKHGKAPRVPPPFFFFVFGRHLQAVVCSKGSSRRGLLFPYNTMSVLPNGP
mmetsp:Transcript_84093/g.175919  ORF Transcript_84093/g.175919 Transcript_84093/m.175919 type:complete len:96 (+) Transcript_84093:636-923(+)